MLRLALDAGHGINTAGKRCHVKLDPKETRENVLNRRVADKVCDRLNLYDCEVLRVDDVSGKNDVSLVSRVNKSNNFNADVFISIHHNAGLNCRNGGGITVYYSSSKAERKTQAENLYKCLIARTGLKGNRSNPVSKKGFYVIKHTTAKSFLIENGFMDSPQDVPIILSEAHADKTADAIVDFLVSSFGLTKKSSSETPSKPSEKDYEAIGRALEKCMNDLDDVDSFKELFDLL